MVATHRPTMKSRVLVWLDKLKMIFIRPRMRGESFRKWVSRNMDHSPLATLIDVFQVVLGITVTAIYFHANWKHFQAVAESPTIQNIQIVIGIFFTLDYIVRFFAADSREMFVLSSDSFIDLATILPQWMEMAISDESGFKNQANALKTLRALRFLRAFRLLVFAKTAKGKQACVLFLTVMSIIICTAGIFQALEQCPSPTATNCQTLEIYNACYLVVITIATVGYGDLAPKSEAGRIGVIFLILLTGILLPLQISRYSDILSRETEYDKSFKQQTELHPHILICGEVNSSALDFFLRQFLHPNNINWKDKVVILCPSYPSHNLRRILLNPAYEQRVVYLQGSAMLDSDLKRANASCARMCFILLNKLSQDGDRNDTASNLLTISLRHHTSNVPLFVQVLKTDNIHHIHISGATNIVCVDEIKLGVLAKACVIPGLCAFLCNILFTFRPFHYRSTFWAAEFLAGCAHDIYAARIPKFLDGFISFSTFAFIVYQEFSAILLATSEPNSLDMKLFPSKRTLFHYQRIFILATTPDVVVRIEDLTLAVVQKYALYIPHYHDIATVWHENSIQGKLKSMRSRATTTTMNRFSSSRVSLDTSRAPPELTQAVDNILKRKNSDARVIPVDEPGGPKGSSKITHRPSFPRLPGEPTETLDTVSGDATKSVDVVTKRRHTGVITRVLPTETGDDHAAVVDDDADERHDDDEHMGNLVARTDDLICFAELAPIQQPPEEVPAEPSQPHEATPPGKTNVPATTTMTTPEAEPQAAHADDSTPPLEPAAPPEDHPMALPSPKKPPMLPPLMRRESVAFALFMDVNVPANLTNHIILLGMPNSLFDFVAPLRPASQNLPPPRVASGKLMPSPAPVPIVVISQMPMSEKLHASIAMFNDIYYVHGSALDESVLREASVFSAKSIVIISTCLENPSDHDHEVDAADTTDQNMMDTDAITLHRYVTEACECNCPDGHALPTIVIELSRPSSLRFLKDEKARTDTAETREVVKMHTKQVLSRVDDPLDNICHPIYAAGNVFISNSLDAILGSCNRHGAIIDLFHLLVFGDPGDDGDARVLDQIAIPDAFAHTSYGKCVVDLLQKRDVLCLGLYRARPNHHHFVYINPSEDTMIHPNDKLFVLR
ncbi:Aste57867_25258 [Aphanomyces stellatus]|uniref:BK channel n=1 Tax=Aphanomyces stellatus TaxID=120398 RepID=A0A485LV28_9STRA|nr:hypothetical protein As57867_025180 [Aphanomyces stellatus]VFU01884.1 Aste57867_25258 [Aphanomyces stellatus]